MIDRCRNCGAWTQLPARHRETKEEEEQMADLWFMGYEPEEIVCRTCISVRA